MTKERVTRDDLRNMRVGQQLIFVLPDAKLCESARVQAAQLAAWFSKGKQADRVMVDYTFRKYVKKPGGSKPGFVIYTNQQTLYVIPDEKLAARLAADK